MDDIRTLLRDAVEDVHADPRLGPSIVQGQRRSRHRLFPLVAVAAAVLLVLALVGFTVALSRTNRAAAPPADAPSVQPSLPSGPDGPSFDGSGPSRLVGRVYSVGQSPTDDGRPARVLAFWVELPVPAAGGTAAQPTAVPCTARWVPGTALSDSRIDLCDSHEPAYEPPVDGPVAVTRHDASQASRFMRLPRRTARAEVKLALTRELPAYATPEGGNPPVRIRQPVTLLGADDPDAPGLIAVVPPTPRGYTYVGTDSWDAAGRPILHTLRGYYCGPDPQRPMAPYQPCPR